MGLLRVLGSVDHTPPPIDVDETALGGQSLKEKWGVINLCTDGKKEKNGGSSTPNAERGEICDSPGYYMSAADAYWCYIDRATNRWGFVETNIAACNVCVGPPSEMSLWN